MKRALYNIADEEFAYFVNELGKNLDKQNIPYVLVGGTATQLHTIKRLHKIYNQDIVTMDENIRLQDFIRSTDDIDIALSPQVYNKEREIEYIEKMNNLFDDLCIETISPSNENIFEYKLARRGAKKPIFQVFVDGKTNDEQRITLNIGRRPEDLANLESKFYQVFVDGGQRIQIPYNHNDNFIIDTRVINPTHLFASKTSHFRAKDTMDIYNLADLMRENHEKIDLQEIEKILGVNYSRNYERFLSLITPNH